MRGERGGVVYLSFGVVVAKRPRNRDGHGILVVRDAINGIHLVLQVLPQCVVAPARATESVQLEGGDT